ncbi:MAG: ABC transporter permease [Alphaproteobacteria bacterium]|nr:ABC transporter permease [Alphaproteobacteria bacterium]
MMWTLLNRAIIVFVFVFLLLPLVFVVVTSFGDAAMTFPPRSFSLEWYGAIPQPFITGLKVSLIVGGSTAFIAAVVGTGAALAITRGRFRGLKILAMFCLLPLMVPSLVIAVALFQFTGILWDIARIEIGGTLIGLILGHTAIAIPYVVRAVIAGHAHFDPTLEEAALNLGASKWRTLLSITLPVLIPGIVSGAVFAFLVSFDDVPIALFMGGDEATTTMPVKIFTSIEYSMKPDVMAVSALVIYVSLALMILLEKTLGLERFFGTGRA